MFKLKKEWSMDKQGKFLTHTGELLKRGYRLEEAFQFLALHQGKGIAELMQHVLSDLRSGHTINESLGQLRFPKDIHFHLFISEQNGELANGFIWSGHYLKKRSELKQKVVKLLRYPMILGMTTFLLMFILIQFVVPHHQTLYSSLNIELPVITRWLLQLYTYVPWIGIGSFLFIIVCWLHYRQSFLKLPPSQKLRFLMKIPVVSRITKKLTTYLFCVTVGGLLQGGLSILNALQVCKEQSYLSFLQEEAEDVMYALESGNALAGVLKERGYYKPELMFVIDNGEKTGNLASDLLYFATVQFDDFEEKFHQWMIMLQPILLSIIGLIIFVLFLAMMLPIFKLVEAF